MSVLLMILKIIGIVLLCILGLILLILVLVLATPFRYQLDGAYHDEPEGKFKFHFWFQMIALEAEFKEKKLSVILRILFFKKSLMKKDFNKKEEKEAPEKTEDLTESQENKKEPLGEEEVQSENQEELIENENQEEIQTENQDEQIQQEKKEEIIVPENKEEPDEDLNSSENSSSNPPKESLDEKIDRIIEKIQEKADALSKKYASIKKKICDGIELAKKNKAALALIKKQLFKVVKSVMPKKIRGNLKIGLSSPQTMGMITSVAAIIYPWYKEWFRFEPVFDEEVIDGEVHVKGRIIIGAILGHLLKLVFYRDIWKLISDVRWFGKEKPKKKKRKK